MASPDDTTSQGASERPSSSEKSVSSTTLHYQHPFPFTVVPNCFIDAYVPHLSATAQSVMLVFYRLTLGWHRADIFISLNELRQRTGIASFATLNGALKELLDAGLITVVQQRGPRGLKGYCLTPAALSFTDSVAPDDEQKPHNGQKLHRSSDQPTPSSTDSVALNQAHPSHNVQFLHTTPDDHASSSTDSVEVPLQILTQYLYRNRNSTSTESVEVTSSQPTQGQVPDKPKERLKKAKETNKEIDRYVRMQNETQNELEEHTNTHSPAAFLTRLLEQHAIAHTSGTAAAPPMDERLDAPHAPTSNQPSSTPEANTPTPTTLPRQQASVPNAAAEHTRPHQTQRRSPASEDAVEIVARRQRLLALQQELAQLKRTTSMQLLARQRIPRLEEAIKQLITSLAESA